ncbi:MAG: carbamoyltransferase C-terminal domain-containing protein [Planctomycetota bacterium]
MIVLGFSGIENGDFYAREYGLRFVGHDSSVALVIDGKVAFAAEEERFSREKHTSRLPVLALRAALAEAGIQLGDVDHLAYTWSVSFRQYLDMCLHHAPRVPPRHALALAATGVRVVRDLMLPRRVARRFARAVGEPLPPCQGVVHHMGHASAAFLPSPFERAAVLTIDGQGEAESASLGLWEGVEYTRLASVRSPDSIGILYGMVTDFLGMRAGWDEYKVMAMAARGDAARFRDAFGELVQILPGGLYRTPQTALVFRPGACERVLADAFGVPARRAGEELTQVHFDLAAGLQDATERVAFHLLDRLRAATDAPDLCLAGGVALNSVLNGKIRRSGRFERVWVPPAPGDHGGALGAALHVYYQRSGAPRDDVGFTPYLGPGADEGEMLAALQARAADVAWTRPRDLVDRAADLLARDRILGWFQGRMEYGPRALGHRSILASPRREAMRDRVNARIKHREGFRPFAGVVPAERAAELFDVEGESPYMQFVVPVREAARTVIPAVVHDGTCRVQTLRRSADGLLHSLLTAFEREAGVPVLLNTSFNDADEPIVCTPSDAIETFLHTGLDALVLGPFLVLPSTKSAIG